MLVLSYLFKHELRLYFPRWFSPFFQIGITLSTLIFYWYFSKSIVAAPGLGSEMPEGYFIYILVGELSLLWPGVLLANSSRVLKQFYYKRALENLIVLKNQAATLLIKMSVTQVILQSFKYVIYFFAILIFSQTISVSSLIIFFIIQLVYVPLFLSLGLFAACIVVMYGRGEKIIQMFVSASYVLAGVYFPVKVFPGFVQNIFKHSPFNDLINLSRSTLSGELNLIEVKWKLLSYLLLGFVLMFVSKKMFCYLITKCDRPINHRPLIS